MTTSRPGASKGSKSPLTSAATVTYNEGTARRRGEAGNPQETSMAVRHGGPANAWHGHFEPKRVPEGVWMRCDGCHATLFRKQVVENYNVCPECNHHFPVTAAERIKQLLDEDGTTFEEWYPDLRPGD